MPEEPPSDLIGPPVSELFVDSIKTSPRVQNLITRQQQAGAQPSAPPGMRFFKRKPLRTGLIGSVGAWNIRDHAVIEGSPPYQRRSATSLVITKDTRPFAIQFVYEAKVLEEASLPEKPSFYKAEVSVPVGKVLELREETLERVFVGGYTDLTITLTQVEPR